MIGYRSRRSWECLGALLAREPGAGCLQKGKNKINSIISTQATELLTCVLRLLAFNMGPHSFVALAEAFFVSGCDCTLLFTFACRFAHAKHADVLLAFKHCKSVVNHGANVIFACVVFGVIVFGGVFF